MASQFENGLCERLRKIQNTSQNLGWGINNYYPPMKTDLVEETQIQFMICVGHNVYREMHFLFLESLIDGRHRLSIIDGYKPDCIIAFGSEDDCVNAVCEKLREWFPSVSATVYTRQGKNKQGNPKPENDAEQGLITF